MRVLGCVVHPAPVFVCCHSPNQLESQRMMDAGSEPVRSQGVVSLCPVYRDTSWHVRRRLTRQNKEPRESTVFTGTHQFTAHHDAPSYKSCRPLSTKGEEDVALASVGGHQGCDSAVAQLPRGRSHKAGLSK